MSNFAETTQHPPHQLTEAVNEVFQNSSLGGMLDDIRFALEHNNPDVAYAAAQKAASVKDIAIDELPNGVEYEDTYTAYDFEGSPAVQAQAIFDRVGKICFGEQPDIVKIYAPDGEHSLRTTDLQGLLDFLSQKGYKRPETDFDSAAHIGDVPKIDIIREMIAQRTGVPIMEISGPEVSETEMLQIVPETAQSISAPLQPEATRSVSIPEAHQKSPALTGEELLAIGRILLNKTLARHPSGRIEERSLRDTLLSKYNFTEEELTTAYAEVEHAKLQLLADLPETRTATKSALQSRDVFDVNTSRVINTALWEFVDTPPTNGIKRKELSLEQHLGVRAQAGVRETDVKRAKFLLGLEKPSKLVALANSVKSGVRKIGRRITGSRIGAFAKQYA